MNGQRDGDAAEIFSSTSDVVRLATFQLSHAHSTTATETLPDSTCDMPLVASPPITRSEADPTVVHGRFRLEGTLGEGSWGEVMRGVDMHTQTPVAIKLTRQNSALAIETLRKEFLVYQALSQFRGRDVICTTALLDDAPVQQNQGDERFTVDLGIAASPLVVGLPKVVFFEHHRDHNDLATSACLVLGMLGPSIEDLRQYCFGSFDEATVLMIADQAIARIEHIHRCGYLHRDIKPDNFLMGTGPTSHILYLIDFGLASTYRVGATEEALAQADEVLTSAIEGLPHVEPRERVGIAGTLRYASAGATRGNQQSRRDDLQALVYCLVFLATGDLPWSSSNRERSLPGPELVAMKENLPVDTLCAPCTYLTPLATAVHALKFEERPPYGYLRYLVRRQLTQDNLAYDYAYAWVRKRVDEVNHRRRTSETPTYM
jgi:serine/threonine protein kinase